MLSRSNARRTAKPQNTKKGCTQIIMSTAFFAFITFYNRMHIAFLLLRLHHIAARVNA